MHAAVAFAVATAVTYLLGPVAIRLAARTAFYDLPVGYKGHRHATPYLGGTAIVVGLLAALAIAGGTAARYTPILVCTLLVWLMGTLDDRFSLPIRLRLIVEVGVGAALAGSGLGWSVFHHGLADGVLTVVWVVGVMNAFNLMDNMDGAAATTAAVSAIGAGTLALVSGRTQLAPLCFATGGACLGFLPRNLANPARIFMGDGGSLPLGLLVAAVAMSAVNRDYLGPRGVVIGALLVGLVIFDTTLVSVSRTRAGRPIFRGGRDHTTHRLAMLLGSAQRVAVTLAGTQLLLCAITIGIARAGGGWILVVGAFAVGLAVVLIWQLETSALFSMEPLPTGSKIDGCVGSATNESPEIATNAASAAPDGSFAIS